MALLLDCHNLQNLFQEVEADEEGFTLVELLVIMLVMGVLAAIAVPTFLSQKSKAYESSAKSDATQIAQELLGFYVDGSGTVTLTGGASAATWQMTSGALVVAGGRLSPGNSVSAASSITSDDDYCVAVLPAFNASAWRATQSGLRKGDC